MTMAAIVVITAAFLPYILDDESAARRYLKIGLLATLITYLVTFWWWAGFSRANPDARFGQIWVSGLYHLVSAVLILWAMSILYRTKGWLRNVMMLALFLFMGADPIKLASVPLDEVTSLANYQVHPSSMMTLESGAPDSAYIGYSSVQSVPGILLLSRPTVPRMPGTPHQALTENACSQL